MRHRHHRKHCKGPLESFRGDNFYSERAPSHVRAAAIAQDTELAHFRRLARIQGIEAATNAYSKEEILKMMRVNGFTYINPRARKIDLAHALAGMV